MSQTANKWEESQPADVVRCSPIDMIVYEKIPRRFVATTICLRMHLQHNAVDGQGHTSA